MLLGNAAELKTGLKYEIMFYSLKNANRKGHSRKRFKQYRNIFNKK